MAKIDLHPELHDFAVPKLPEFPKQLFFQGQREIREVERYREISNLVGCDLPAVEFSFGGYDPHRVPNPIKECDECRGGKACPTWSLNISRGFARMSFEGNLKKLRKSKIDGRKEGYKEVISAARSAEKFLKDYRKVWVENQGLLGWQYMGRKGSSNKPVHSTPEDIEKIVETLTEAARRADDLLTGLPSRKGGTNLAALYCANRVGILFKAIEKPITHGSNPITAEPAGEFSQAIKLTLELFDPEISGRATKPESVNWDAHSRRVARLMRT